MMRFSQITLLHGQGELPNGSVERLEALLRTSHPMVTYSRPLLPQGLNTAEATDWFERYYLHRIDRDALLVGIDRGGLIASAIQSMFPALHLSVAAINSPTEENGVIATPCDNPNSRLALYSSAYPPIAGRCDWKPVTPLAYDVWWLANGSTLFYPLAYLISAWGRGADMDKEVSMIFGDAPEV